MSLCLYLLPYATNSDRDARADDLLQVELDWGAEHRNLPDLLEALPARDVPRHFRCRLARSADGERYVFGEATEDDYGGPLRWVRAGDLAALTNHPQVMIAPRNRAAFASPRSRRTGP
ncbi:hypothetical protein [Sorangium sp. So ce388]|uniref:hypothetical protein n=1 Tax=Sorangium sp. So ce388 TaxID=3133309 RepID=UPI003F5C34C9